MDFKEDIGLYLIAGGVILFVLAQSVFFLVKAWKQGQKLGIDKKKLRDAVTSSAVFTIPSALSVLATVIVLAPSLGLVIPWVRLSVLGNLLYETKAAGDAMTAFGQEGGISSVITDPEIFAGVAWVMTLGICFSLVLLPFVAKPLHKKVLSLGKKDENADDSTEKKEKKSGGIAGFIDLLTPAVFIGLIGAFVARAIAGKGKPETFGDGAGVLSVITLVVAVAASLILEKIATKFKLTWLEPFVMPIGMILAMVVAVVAYNVLPPEIAIFEWRG